jgi:chromosome partitioning protein
VSKPSPGATSSSPRSDKGTQRPATNKDQGVKKRAPSPPAEPGVARIVAIANQKGGVGKSTTAVSLGAALAELGYRILVVDLDPQGNASTGMGIRHEARRVTVYDVVLSEAPVESAIVPTSVKHLDAVPSTIDLAGAEIELVSQFSRETRLKKALAPVGEGRYDFIFLDCPPSLGLLTINALTAADELIVPIQCEYYALEGLGQLLRNVNLVQQNINPELRLTGIVMTMFDPRTKLSEQVVEEVRRFFGEVVYDVVIPRTVRLSEAPGFGQPITVYDPRSKGAECYRELAHEVAARPRPESPMPVFDDLPSVVVQPLSTEPPRSSDEEPLPADEPIVEGVPDPEPKAEPDARSEDSKPEDSKPEDSKPEDSKPEDAEAPAPHMDPEKSAAGPGAEAAVASTADPLPAPPAPALGELDTPRGEPSDLEWIEATAEPRVRPPREVLPPGRLPERRVVVIGENAEIDIEAAREPLVQVPQGARPPVGRASDIGETLQDDEDAPKRRWRLFRKGGQ